MKYEKHRQFSLSVFFESQALITNQEVLTMSVMRNAHASRSLTLGQSNRPLVKRSVQPGTWLRRCASSHRNIQAGYSREPTDSPFLTKVPAGRQHLGPLSRG